MGKVQRYRVPDVGVTRQGMNEKILLRNTDPIAHQQSIIRQQIKQKKADLPHLYGWKWYRWAKAFFESTNKINLLCAANQCSKSSTMIRKNIEWACNKKLWPKLWDTEPKQFWYFYPSAEVATVEFEKKWVPEFLPRGTMKDDPQYGWTPEYRAGEIVGIHFRSGCTIYFKSYGQKIVNLQTATIHMVSPDEEMEPGYVDELMARLRRTNGYFNSVFTATKGYELWYRAMECMGMQEEAFPQAFKQVVSLYDCQVYEDGSPSIWTPERIKEAEASCTTAAEIQRRIYGRFVKDEGRKYAAFSPDRNTSPAIAIPKDWKIYGGVDVGSGGAGRSAAAVIFVAVNPDFTKGRVYKSWRGDHEETTANDILRKYRELRGEDVVTQACYDYQSREFGLIASRSAEPFIAADKRRDAGEHVINLLFQAGALTIDSGVYDNQKLVMELMSVPAGVKNRKYKDDATDCLRYICQLIPWNFPKITPGQELPEGMTEEVREDIPDPKWTEKQYLAWEIRQRRGERDRPKDGWDEFYEEIDSMNELYGN